MKTKIWEGLRRPLASYDGARPVDVLPILPLGIFFMVLGRIWPALAGLSIVAWYGSWFVWLWWSRRHIPSSAPLYEEEIHETPAPIYHLAYPTNNYFFDLEFIESGPDYPIVPISIGIVSHDGREYYAELDIPDEAISRVLAHDWIMANVWPHLNHQTKDRPTVADEIKTFVKGNHPAWWSFCGDYDWVVLNQLYGTMMDHPTKWPFYTNDLRQLSLHKGIKRSEWPAQVGVEHNALADAKWNKEVYEWLKTQ